MRLLEAASLQQLTQKESKPKYSKIEVLASVDPEFRTHVRSREFFPYRIETNKLAAPLKQEGLSMNGPIVVDINAAGVGKVKGYTPKVIVVSGLKAFADACAQRLPRVPVLLGSLAAKALDIKAHDAMSSDELKAKIQNALSIKWTVPNTKGWGGGPVSDPVFNTPVVQDVYPLEGYFTFNCRAKFYKMMFTMNNDQRTVTLSSTPIEVDPALNPIHGKPMSSRMEAAADLYAHCGDVKAHDDEPIAEKDGVVYSTGTIIGKFKKAMRGGYKPKMEAKSPPGWKGTTEAMKKHPDIDNPWALAWWMDEQGYHSHKGG